MATLKIATKEALQAQNITPLSELWVTRFGPNTGTNMVARATGNNADFEKGVVDPGKQGVVFGWEMSDHDIVFTDKYRCFGARCIEVISGGTSDANIKTTGADPLGLEMGQNVTLSIYYNVISFIGGLMLFRVWGRSTIGNWTLIGTMAFGNESKTNGWKRAEVTVPNGVGTFAELMFDIQSSNYNGRILIDRPQAELGVTASKFYNGNEYTDLAPAVQWYSASFDRKYGANTLSLRCANPNGEYSYDKSSNANTIEDKRVVFFDMMNPIVLKEGIIDANGDEEWWTRFTGYIDGQTPGYNGSEPTISIDCTDAIKILLIDKIDERFEPKKEYVFRHPLTTEDEKRMIFDSGMTNWAQNPPAEIYLVGDDDAYTLIDYRQYSIDYARGKVYFNYPRDEEEEFVATFYQYTEGTNTLGEVIRRACRMRGLNVGDAFDEEDNYTLYGADQRDNSIDPKHAGQVLLDFYDPRVDEYIEPQVPPSSWDMEDNTNYYEAIENVRRGIIAPNFILKADAHGTIRGFYSFQKVEPDHTLMLPKALNIPISDMDVFSRVVVYGRSTDNRGLAEFATVQKEQSSPYEEGDVKNIIDGSVDTQFVQHWGDHDDYKPPVEIKERERGRWMPPAPMPFITLDFGKNISEIVNEELGYDEFDGVSQIQLEGAQPVNKEIYSAGRVNGDQTSLAIKYKLDGEDEWHFLCEEAKDFRLARNQIVTFSKANFGDHIDFRYLRIYVTEFSRYTADVAHKKGKSTWNAWNAGIANIQVWPENRIIGQAVNSELAERIGPRTYVVPEDAMIDTQEKADALAKVTLNEVSRNLRRIGASVVFAPFLDIGETVRVEDTVHGIDKLFYIESVTYTRSGVEPSVDIEMVAYD